MTAIELLRRRFDPREWIVLTEVASGDGLRRADAIAVSVWRGTIVGFEVKAYRADWLREIARPEKADVWREQVDEWWLVAPRAVVADEREIPEWWGWLEVQGEPPSRLRARRQPTRPERHPVPRWLLARLLLRTREHCLRVARDAARDADASVHERVQAKLAESRRREIEAGQGAQELIDRFSKVSGQRLTSWSVDSLAQSVRDAAVVGRVRGIRPGLGALLAAIDSVLEADADADEEQAS